MKFKKYIIGFLKGLGILVIVQIIYNLLHSLYQLPHGQTNWSLILSLLITGLLFNGYLVIKYHQHKVWLIVSLFLTFYLTPFLMGNIEITKAHKKH